MFHPRNATVPLSTHASQVKPVDHTIGQGFLYIELVEAADIDRLARSQGKKTADNMSGARLQVVVPL